MATLPAGAIIMSLATEESAVRGTPNLMVTDTVRDTTAPINRSAKAATAPRASGVTTRHQGAMDHTVDIPVDTVMDMDPVMDTVMDT